jgi:DNA-binding transcriptional ArsR family regulator
MDVSDPTQAVTGTLDGPVLAALAAAGKPMTVGQLAQRTARGSEIGIRRSLARLTSQGIVRATLVGRNRVHELNRDHIAAPVADLLAGLRNELWTRLRGDLSRWRPRPAYACVFGSAARGDGDENSDIDLLLVHPLFQGDKRPPRTSKGVRKDVARAVDDALEDATSMPAGPRSIAQWEKNVDGIRERVLAWTGNHLQVVQLSLFEWREIGTTNPALLDDVRQDGIEIVPAASTLHPPTAGRQRA